MATRTAIWLSTLLVLTPAIGFATPRSEVRQPNLSAVGAAAEFPVVFLQEDETAEFKVTVVDSEGKPVAGATVEGRYAVSPSDVFAQAKCDDAGQLETRRLPKPLWLFAQSADKRLVGLARIDGDAKEARIDAVPGSTATGVLKDPKGNPLADKSLSYGIRIFHGESNTASDNFGGKVKTDAEGKFLLERVVPGKAYILNVWLDDRNFRSVMTFTARSDETLDLGEVTFNPITPLAYTPPTPAQRATRAFAANPNVQESDRIAALLAEAKSEYFRPLVIFGTADDPACIELFRLLYERPTAGNDKDEEKGPAVAPAEMRWEFDFVSLDVTRPGVREYAKELGVDLSGDKSCVALLDEQGKLSEVFPLELSDGQLDPQKLSDWMARHKLPTRNAVATLQAALDKAKAENKRVLFTFSATWCGPCRMLSRTLAPYKPELEKHIVFVKVDVSRDEDIDELRERFPESKRAGVPWYCVLDPQEDGKVLIDSNRPRTEPAQIGDRVVTNTNIGFPSSPEGVGHLLKMYQLAGPNLEEATLEQCKNALLKR